MGRTGKTMGQSLLASGEKPKCAWRSRQETRKCLAMWRTGRRNHLDLQINLLAEEETTKVLKMLGEIAARDP